MNHKVHSIIIFIILLANPFSLSQAVFFKREKATPINQEARILGLRKIIGSLLRLNNSHARTFRVCFHTVCLRSYFKISGAYNIYHESQMTWTYRLRFARQLWVYYSFVVTKVKSVKSQPFVFFVLHSQSNRHNEIIASLAPLHAKRACD